MNAQDIIYRFFLSFSHTTMIVPIILIGYTFYNRRKWGTAVYIILFTMILSAFLKNIWKIPLPEGLNGYAFPSGHMQAATAFYGWVMLQCRSRAVSLICSSIMIGIAFGLVYFGYHKPYDVIGGLVFGALSLAAYSYILNKFFTNIPEKIGILLALMGLGLIYLLPPMNHLWLAEGALIGFTLGWIIAQRTPMPIGLWNKGVTLVTSIAGIGAIKFVSASFTLDTTNIFVTYAMVGFWIAVAPWLVARISYRMKGI